MDTKNQAAGAPSLPEDNTQSSSNSWRRRGNNWREGRRDSWHGRGTSQREDGDSWRPGTMRSWRPNQEPFSRSGQERNEQYASREQNGRFEPHNPDQQVAGQSGDRNFPGGRSRGLTPSGQQQGSQQPAQGKSGREAAESLQVASAAGGRKLGGVETRPGLLGTCLDMCPEKERRDRERFKDLAIFERVGGSREHTSAELAVKKFSRNAAERPEDIRPLPVLLRTMDYLLGLLDDSRGQSLVTVHGFLWDRFRAIRQDLTLQHCFSPPAVQLHEQMVRFHILSHYELSQAGGVETQARAAPPGEERFEPHMNLEQLSKTLAGLFQMYDDLHRKGGVEFATEGEFRAYYILLQKRSRDGQLDSGVVTSLLMRLRPSLLRAPEVRFALRAFCCARAGDYVRLFRMAAKATYLQACLLHWAFGHVRFRAFQALNKASMKGQAWPLASLSALLATDGEVPLSSLCLEYGLQLGEDRQGQPAVLLNQPGVLFKRPEVWVTGKAALVDGLRRPRSLKTVVECT